MQNRLAFKRLFSGINAVADLLVATRQCVFLDRMLYRLYIFYALESNQQPQKFVFSSFCRQDFSTFELYLYFVFIFVIRMF